MASLELEHHNNNKIKELLPPGWGQSRHCDTCRSAAAGNRHERVVMCEVCEQAPAAVTCKAYAASLCAACDADIPSANPLAIRHERIGVNVIPFLDSLSSEKVEEEEWLVENPSSRVLTADFLCCVSDLLDFGFSSNQNVVENGSFGLSDSVVPTESNGDLRFSDDANWLIEKCFDIDFSHPAEHSASSSETGVVPDGNTNLMSEVSYTVTNSSGDGVDGGGSSAGTGAPARATDRREY